MRTRATWLGSWWFLAAVGLLAVNDHLLKDRYPSWWTGKLSDLAGLAVVATLAAVLLGRRAGLLAGAVAWVGVKAVPGVAEAVAPVLGGTTRRDPTDLVALLVLLPLWAVCRSPAPTSTPPDPATWATSATSGTSGDRVRDRRPIGRRRWSAGLAAGLPVVGICAAVLATTATACGGDPAVVRVVPRGTTVWAEVDRTYAVVDPADADWLSSSDGGRTWEDGSPPAQVVAIARAQAGVGPDGVASTAPTSATPPVGGRAEPSCDDVACYRIVDRRRIERAPVGSERWVGELGLDDDEFADISTGCSDPQKGVLTSVAAVGGTGGRGAVASLGADGVAVRDAEGTWETVRVVDRPPDRLEQLLVVGGIGTVVAVLGLLVLVVVLVRRSRRRRPPPPAPWVGTGGWRPPPPHLPPPPDPG